MTNYTHDEEGLVFLRSRNQQTNTIHYRALDEVSLIPAIQYALETDDWNALFFHLVRTDKRVRDDGEVFHKYAPLPVVLGSERSELAWFMFEAREKLEELVTPKGSSFSKFLLKVRELPSSLGFRKP